MLSGHWLSFQVHLALEGDGANDMLRPCSNVGLPRLPCIALYCLVLPCIADKRGSPTPLLPQSGLFSYCSKTGACVIFERFDDQ